MSRVNNSAKGKTTGMSSRAGAQRASRKPRRANTGKKWLMPTLIAASLVAIIAIYFVAMGADAFDKSAVCRGVYVDGTELSAMDASKAYDAVYKEQNPFENSEVTISSNGISAVITAADISATADFEKTAANALAYGHSGNIFKDIYQAYKARVSGIDIGYSVSVDEAKLEKVLTDFSHKVGGTLANHEIVIEQDYVMIVPGKEGLGMNSRVAKEMFMENLLPGKSSEIEVPYENTKPADISVEEIYRITKVEPSDAHYEKIGKTEVVVKEAVRGREIDIKEAEKVLSGFGCDSETVKIPFVFTEPQIKTEDLADSLFEDTLASYKSPYNAANYNRTSNLKIAANNINGIVLLPGEEFSYNETVGERSVERGFKAASVYENNRSVDGIGGGICQVSSTIYAAALYADLEIKERHEHSLEVPYVPLGMDATVSWGYLDFKFANNMPTPIKINVSVSGGYVYVDIIGTDWEPEKTVKMENITLSKTPRGVTYEDDPELEVGESEVESPGFDGYVVDTYKTVSVDGVQGERVKISTSRYRMANKIVRQGTKEPEPTPAPEEGAGEVSSEPQSTPSPEITPTPQPTPEAIVQL